MALVTGGSRGIGRALALALASRGAQVAIGARSLAALELVKGEVERLGVACLAQVCDVRDEHSVRALVESAAGSLGPIDILVNNAAVYRTAPVKGHSLSVWKDVLETNLTGAFLASRWTVESMIERHWGRVVNISSVSGKVAEAFGAAYSASKFGLIGLTQALALEVAKYGITVNAVCPGWVDTQMARDQINDRQWLELNSLGAADGAEITRLSIPQMRFIEPEEVANLVAYLCTEAARGITGQAINICGGLSLH